MEWLHTLFFGSGIAHAVLTFALVITIGILLGKVKIGGISLGITWILFVGIVPVSYTHLDVYKRQQRSLYQSQMGLVNLVAQQYINYVNLCKALGGGW